MGDRFRKQNPREAESTPAGARGSSERLSRRLVWLDAILDCFTVLNDSIELVMDLDYITRWVPEIVGYFGLVQRRPTGTVSDRLDGRGDGGFQISRLTAGSSGLTLRSRRFPQGSRSWSQRHRPANISRLV